MLLLLLVLCLRLRFKLRIYYGFSSAMGIFLSFVERLGVYSSEISDVTFGATFDATFMV